MDLHPYQKTRFSHLCVVSIIILAKTCLLLNMACTFPTAFSGKVIYLTKTTFNKTNSKQV